MIYTGEFSNDLDGMLEFFSVWFGESRNGSLKSNAPVVVVIQNCARFGSLGRGSVH